MEKRISIDVNGAIRHYNRVRKPKNKMTLESLGKIVFSKDTIQPSSQMALLSNWNSGERLERLKVWHIVVICSKTGYPLNELITVN